MADISDLRPFIWTELDRKAVNLARTLVMDAVEEAGSGHPGAAMSLAPAAYLLYQRLMRHDPTDPHWIGRDRFVLSCGHAVLAQYVQQFLSGYGLGTEDLRQLRRWGSALPGHPEYGSTGIETTTGPLGQGLGNAVGMAMAARRERGLFDPHAAPGKSPLDHTIWVIVSDGDLDEGISHEVSALAAHQKLGNLVVIHDDNHISIEDDTLIARSEDVGRRFEAYGWHVQRVDWAADGSYTEDVAALHDALVAAKAETSRPSFVALRTIIGWPAPQKRNTWKAHGGRLGPEEVADAKRLLGCDPDATFAVDEQTLEHAREVVQRARQNREEWEELYTRWREADPARAAEFDRVCARRLPEGWAERIPTFAGGVDMATRVASGKILTALAPVLPELWGGSADVASSTNTTMEGEPSFVPEAHATKQFPGHKYGRTLHFGVREHGMGAVLSGIALHGGTRPYGGTFLAFSDYMRPSVRLAAMMKAPVIYVWTHDSIGVGGDGPTHQPVEHLWALRAIPGLDVVRPADANETAVAWRTIIERADRPAGLCLTRQDVPVLDRERANAAPAEGVARGAYVLQEASNGSPDVILIATGSEIQYAVEARVLLEAEGIVTRVVSMPCLEWYREQDEHYRQSVLPDGVRARVSVEAGLALGWREIIGEAGVSVSLEHYGASAEPHVLFRELGFTAEHVARAGRTALANAAGRE